MKKLMVVAISIMLCIAMAVPAFASSHANALVTAGATLLEENFEGDDVSADDFDIWSGYKVEGGKLHLGHGGDWVASSPIARTKAKYSNVIISFKMVGDKRDCYYGFGIRADESHTLMNGGRFNVPSTAEKAEGIAIDIFGAGNSTLGDNIGVTFCDGGENGSAPYFTVARPEGFDPGVETEFKVIDSGNKITVLISDKEVFTIELSELNDGVYTKAAAFNANGDSLGEFDVSVFAEGTVSFYQRNNHITVDDLLITELVVPKYVVHGASFDTIFVNNVLNFGQTDGDASGKLDGVGRTVNSEDGSVTEITLRGWIGFEDQEITQFGYKVGDNDPVFSESFIEERGDIGAIQADGNGGARAKAFKIVFDTLNITGTQKIVAVAQLDDGGYVEIDENVPRRGAGTTPNTSFTFVGPAAQDPTQPETQPATQPETQPATQPETNTQTGDFTVAMFAVIAVLAMGAAVVFMKKKTF